MKTGVLYLIFNGVYHVLAVLSGTEPIVEFSSILDLDEFLKGFEDADSAVLEKLKHYKRKLIPKFISKNEKNVKLFN